MTPATPATTATRWVHLESWVCPVLAAISTVLVALHVRASLVPLALAFALFAHLGRRAPDHSAPRHALMACLPFCVGIGVILVVRWTS